jgi:hypothetical protein
MVCLVALIVFSILGIFSLSYRKLAKEALFCLFRKLSLRPCEANFQTKIKTKIVGYLARKKFKGTNFVYKHYESLASFFSLIFLIIFFASAYFSAKGLYNLAIYGFCDLANPQTCPFGKGEICIFNDEQVIKELNLPPAQNRLTAQIYRRLPTIAQRRILIEASKKLSPTDLLQFEQLLKEGDGLKIQRFLSKKIHNFKEIIDQELGKLRKEVMETIGEFEKKIE